jgi:DNA-binding response OmpR family regulator
MRILIVEDEYRLAGNIARSLRESCGYAVDIAPDGEQGLFLAKETPYDAIVLDLMLPRLPGMGVLKGIRSAGIRTPILILTARDEKETVVNLLNSGADDFLSKPFDLGEVRARLQALIRRSQGHAEPKLTLADLELDVARGSVQRAGKVVSLTPMEYRVLEYLMHRSERVVSKNELLEHLYDFNWERFSNVIEVYIAGLRKKIDADNEVKLIHTLRGRGYVVRDDGATS